MARQRNLAAIVVVLGLLRCVVAEASSPARHRVKPKRQRVWRSGVQNLSPAAVSKLSAEYHREVVRGGRSQEKFLVDRGLRPNDITPLRELRGEIDGREAFPALGRGHRRGDRTLAKDDRLVPAERQLPRGARGALTAEQIDAVRPIFARYHRGEITETALGNELHARGMSRGALEELRASGDPELTSRRVWLEAHHAELIDGILDVADRHRGEFRSLPELLSVVNHDPAVTARFGQISRQMVRRDEERGGRLRRTLRDEHGFTERMQVAARQKVAPTRGRTSAPATRGVDVRGMARELARRVEGIDPTPQRLEKVLAELRAEHRGFRDRRRVDFMISTYGGVFPALRRWNFKKGRQFSPRYVARLMSLIHEAGPDADFDQVLEEFRQTDEFAEDGRLPPLGTRFTFDHAPTYPGLIGVWRHRKDFQKTRILLETVRTAPRGMKFEDIVNERLPVTLSASGARVMLRNLTDAKVASLQMSPAVLERIRKNRLAGLGEAADPAFDPNREPPGVDMELVNDVLAMPRAGPAMQHFIKRLDGRRPFAGHRTLFVYHQYSDIVPLMELFIDAGMSAKRTRFVKTSYPFKETVRRNLDFLGVETIEHAQSMPALRDAIAKGLEELLSHNEPILIIDDGGLASSVLRERFPDQIDRVKIFEITEAGHRQADHERRELGRYPVVYGSKARLPVKKQVTSGFHARRVVAKLEALLPQTGLSLPRPKMAVIGAGAMGLPAYKELVRIYRRRGIEVVVVESDRVKAAALARRGITVEDRATALSTSGLILGMTGGSVGEDGKVIPILGPEDLRLLPDGVILAQGSSKQNEFDMAGFARVAARKRELPRTDGLPQKSFTYEIRTGRKTKRLHFLGDGWTLNHDGSLHGTPIADLDLELGVLLEGAAMVADTRVGRTVNTHLEVDEATQDEYRKVWRPRQRK